jgi:hypothetical protein
MKLTFEVPDSEVPQILQHLKIVTATTQPASVQRLYSKIIHNLAVAAVSNLDTDTLSGE